MPRSKPEKRSPSPDPAQGSISLKALAQHLGLSSATVSLVINRSPCRQVDSRLSLKSVCARLPGSSTIALI